jgi:hypothetical protein
VSASHYHFGDEPAITPTILGSSELESQPDIGEDPIRAVARLPGVAGQDFSSRVYMRGGTADETLVRFDDLRLYNPYHLKDFFSVFSTIDPGSSATSESIPAAFRVAFGDRSSGVVDIAPRLPGPKFQGQAVASLLTAGVALDGSFDDGAGDWAVAARRGNMDLYFNLVDSPLGERSTTISTGMPGTGSMTGSRSPRTRSCSTTASRHSTAIWRRKRSPNIATSTTGCGRISARPMGSAGGCSRRIP